ncbi:uncharacterized protein LOC141619964 [Silene latifolia]|uniref:uncharacterized protein LOC141619964 n=1 Tax=Silene latifolia TaxID=37657 RepID=UPI003D77F1C0
MDPVQPKNHEFQFKLIGGKSRRFNAKWFDKHENWLEYSKKKDALFCLPCYLFKPDCVRGGDAFVGEGFSYWNKKQMLSEHVGEVNSTHNLAVERYENLKDEKNSIQNVFHEFSEQDKKDYKTRLEASIICCRYLLRMGLPFRGHDESDVFRELRGIRIAAAISNGDIETEKGLNQEHGIKRPGDTRWGSHYRSLVNLQESFIDVLDFIYNDVTNPSQKKNACGLMAFLRSFDFIFILHFMVDVLGITNRLSVAFQREDQDMGNAMHLVNVCKQRLQAMREGDTEWDDLLEKVHQVCYNCDVEVVDMNDIYVSPGRPKRRAVQNINLHHYRIDVFCAVIDLQLQELNDRFDKVKTELLLFIACLSPKDNFHAFNLSKLQEMATSIRF